MKILLAASCSSNRNLGVPGVMHCLGDQYAARGHEVRYMFRDEPGRLAEASFGIRLARSPSARWADVVDVHAVDAWPLCGRADGPVVVARSHGLERVVHRKLMEMVGRGEASVGGFYRLYRGSLRLWMEARAVGQADAFLVLNESDRKECLADLGGSPDRIRQVPNGFPPEFLATPLEPATGVAVVGSWIHRKGKDLAVPALVRALRGGLAPKALLLGGGVPESVILGEFPDDVRSRLEVRPHFPRSELPSLLRGFGTLLFPSRSEGYPLSLVEAMACGLAPVASAIPGVVEVVSEGVSGRLVPPEDAVALGDVLAETLSDPARLPILREGARAAVRSTSWDAIAMDQLALYAKLLEGRRARR